MRFSPHVAAATTLAVALIPTASASTQQGRLEGHHAQSSKLGQFVAVSSAPAVTTTPTVAGPTTPTTNEPGDNHPALVIGGGLISLGLIAGGWSVARTRIKDDE